MKITNKELLEKIKAARLPEFEDRIEGIIEEEIDKDEDFSETEFIIDEIEDMLYWYKEKDCSLYRQVEEAKEIEQGYLLSVMAGVKIWSKKDFDWAVDFKQHPERLKQLLKDVKALRKQELKKAKKVGVKKSRS